MPLPGVVVNRLNGLLGQTLQSEDGIGGLLLQGVATANLAVLEPKLITILQDAKDLGIDEDYDTANSIHLYAALKLFYAEAIEGAKLYIMLVPQAVNLTTMLDVAESDYAVKLLNFAEGKIRLLGVVRNPAGSYVPNIVANNIDIDVVNALTTGHALGEAFAAKFMSFRCVLPAYSYGGNAGELVDLKTFDKNRIAVLLGGDKSNRNAVALLLGRLAKDPVQRNPGRVKSGALNITQVYLGSEEYLDAQSDIEAIHDKGFVTLTKYVGKAGYYFTDDPTATSSTDDYNSIPKGRVIDKVTYIAYSVFVNEVKDEILIDPNTGKMQASKAKYLESIVDTQINDGMTANGEISGVNVNVDPAQNILANGLICVDLEIIPVGYGKNFKIQLGFNNPTNN